MAEHHTYPQTPIEPRARDPHTPEPDTHLDEPVPPLLLQDPTLAPAAGEKLRLRRRRNAPNVATTHDVARFPLRLASREFEPEPTLALGTPFETPHQSHNEDVLCSIEEPVPVQLMSSPPSEDDDMTDDATTIKPQEHAAHNVCIVPASPEAPYELPVTPVHQMIGDEEDLIKAKNAWEFTPPVLSSDARECQDFNNSRPSTARSVNSIVTEETLDTAATSPEFAAPAVSAPASVTPTKLSFLDKPFYEKPSDFCMEKQGEYVRHKTDAVFTSRMSHHLWTTYLRYIEDPTHTPFKMLPGSLPPTGVLERTLREARRAWGLKRIDHANRVGLTRFVTGPNGTPIEVPGDGHRCLPAWPTRDGPIRRHLQELCRTNVMLAPHYARAAVRTPSPFSTSSDPTIPSSPPPAPKRGASLSSISELQSSPPAAFESTCSSFSTRDMGLSLVTSTADSMQPGGYLGQLGRSDTPPSRKDSVQMQMRTPVERKSGNSSASSVRDSNKRPYPYLDEPLPFEQTFIHKEITRRLSVSQSHQRAQSLHHNLVARSSVLDGPPNVLASPFEPMPSHARAGSLRVLPADAPRPMLKSPIQIQPQHTSKRIRKSSAPRRPQMEVITKHDGSMFDSFTRRQSHVAVHIPSTRPQVRNRGFTMSAIQHGIHNPQGPITSIFTEDAQRMDNNDVEPHELARGRFIPQVAITRAMPNNRLAPALGSPFSAPAVPAMPMPNTFPRMTGNVQDTIMRDEPLIAPQPRRRLHGVLAPPPDNALLSTWRRLPRGPSPL